MKPRNKIQPLPFVLPALFVYILTVIIPILWSMGYSLFSWNGIGDMKFIGLENYVRMFQDETFREAVVNNLKFVVLGSLFQLCAGLILAILLTGITSHTRFRLSRFTLQRCRKSPRKKLLAGSRFPCKNIRVGYLPCLYRILQMPDYIVMADDVMKSCHKNHLFLPFVSSVIPGGHLSSNYNIIFCIKKTIFPYCTDFI